ncbi:indolepyruvate ferredoxin oxidoreductase family protein [Dactylosporangium sucinum]|uniref:Indolepyruvate ferredoxin oxidoreductase n=1 Tax=Dactylosporangium sucinum TaxID=1424081 RepID=A0A917U0F2_9ACTN|nr:indolepyruvate ferredoxin oxidoreductase family protein [Dactylosporangium sucinum]GGM46532.1 indolepyruvate ferredoxin oxidoreductase [Dactylosporangium sucinum]
MTEVASAPAGYQLTDRYDADDGTVVLTGTQAITRILLDRHRIDRAAGLRTGGLASGYPGSPLGGLDLTLHRAAATLAAEDIRHVPGVNEELAAAVVFGTQQPSPGGFRDGLQGVFGLWYGKSPGVDRCGDAFKHANQFGVSPFGGVVAVAGDDPAAKSSSLPNQSETAFYDALMPVLVPGSTQELLDYGVIGLELSRYCGCWVGLKVVTNVADSVGSVNLAPDRLSLHRPALEIDGESWQHRQRVDLVPTILVDRERDLLERRHLAAVAFAAANGLNRIEGATAGARIGIVAAGKTYYDVRQALADLGLDDAGLRERGVRLLKLGMIYPLDPSIVDRFADGLDHVVVVEEKRDFIESALRNALYPTPHRPTVVGKRDRGGQLLVPAHGELGVDRIKPILRRELGLPSPVRATTRSSGPIALPLLARTSAYCSGCPHNRSTVLPGGAVVGGGVGCHGMSYFDPRLADNQKLPVVPMGSEGVPWIGMAPFAQTGHIFQHLGDGTYSHSGLLAVRACVAAGVNITFKILFNGYVAMTGGQEIAGGMSVPALTRELAAEGVKQIIVCAEDTGRYRGVRDLADGVTVLPRDDVLAAQERLSAVEGVTVLIYDQVCAAEARRLRRTGKLPTPDRRVVINELVCEGCGDCGVQSNCLSVQPVETELGRKTQIHQTSCNSDFSCLDGDCPSFVTIRTTAAARDPRRPRRPDPQDVPPEPAAKASAGGKAYGVYLVGIGGTGVVTVNQILATAALLDGLHTAGLDQTGMSQKAGAVVSHLQISAAPVDDRTAAVTDGQADLYLVFDLLSGAAPQHLARADARRTVAVVASSLTPTSAVVTNIATSLPPAGALLDRIRGVAGRTTAVDAARLSRTLFGDETTANVLLLGVAYQAGAVPLSAASIEEAIRLNGVAVDTNIAAFRAGRRHVVTPAEPDAPAPPGRLGAAGLDPAPAARDAVRRLLDGAGLPAAVREIAEPRAAELVDYQHARLARRYVDAVRGVVAAEAERFGTDAVSAEFARYLFKLLAYKDEYEVARLHLKVDLGARVRYHIHPPFLRALGLRRKLALGGWIRPAFAVLRAMRTVRGTPFDLFGLAAVRRVERSLPEEYTTAVLAALRDDDRDRCLAVAQAPDVVRGYETIKLANVARFRAMLAQPSQVDG